MVVVRVLLHHRVLGAQIVELQGLGENPIAGQLVSWIACYYKVPASEILMVRSRYIVHEQMLLTNCTIVSPNAYLENGETIEWRACCVVIGWQWCESLDINIVCWTMEQKIETTKKSGSKKEKPCRDEAIVVKQLKKWDATTSDNRVTLCGKDTNDICATLL